MVAAPSLFNLDAGLMQAFPLQRVGGKELCLAALFRDLPGARRFRSAFRPATATRAPAWARPSASAPPSTPVPPITTATSFDKSNKSIIVFLGGGL